MAKKPVSNGEVLPQPPHYKHTVCSTVLAIPDDLFVQSAIFCPACNGHYPPAQFVPAVD